MKSGPHYKPMGTLLIPAVLSLATSRVKPMSKKKEP
jgi:hypothetical protein